MLRLTPLFVVGCAVCAGLILVDFGSTGNRHPSFEVPAPPEIRKLADPQQRPDTPASANDPASALHDVRLTGVVIGPDLRLAIFAVAGAHSIVLSEGEALKDWRLDSISREKVVLGGPGGSIALEAKPDASLVRPPPPAADWSGQFAPGVPPGMAIPSAPVPPIAVTPITVVNLPSPAPVQVQGNPYYSPEYYDAAYGQYSPLFNGAVYPFPYFAFAVPKRVGFRFGLPHHHDIHRVGFHGMAFHGGGFARRR